MEDCTTSCETPDLSLKVTTEEGDDDDEDAGLCIEWSASGSLSGGTLTLDSGLGVSWTVGRSGEKCGKVSCDKEGEYTATLTFTHEDSECSTEESKTYKIKCDDDG